MELTPPQLDLIEASNDQKIFLEGPAGAGRTTAGVERYFRKHVLPTNRFTDLAPQLFLIATQVNNARKAYWLTMSPLYRADPKNREAFQAKLAAWREDPRKIPEFSKSLSMARA